VRLLVSVGILAIFFTSSALAAEEEKTSDVAIQRPKFRMAHEVALSLGSMPLDAFQKGWSAGLSYTVHFDDYIAWEVFNASAAMLTSTDLRDELIDTFAIPPSDFNAPRFMATTGISVAPIYGKQVFLNDTVVHQQVYLGLHGGVIFGDREQLSETLKDLRPALGLGLGYRVFMTKEMSVRIDIRDFLSWKRAINTNDRADVENVLLLQLSFAVNFWRDDA
jgi:outer membrane beta-barrel protein